MGTGQPVRAEARRGLLMAGSQSRRTMGWTGNRLAGPLKLLVGESLDDGCAVVAGLRLPLTDHGFTNGFQLGKKGRRRS